MRFLFVKSLAVFALSVALTGCGTDSGEMLASYRFEASQAEEVSSTAAEKEEKEEKEESASQTICVYVCGAVETPGVYTLPAVSRVVDAIDAAGGLLPEAEATMINQAKLLSDGEQITVPVAGEGSQTTSLLPAVSADGKVNINTADLATLMQLRGIGEVRAQAIIAYRERAGGFSQIEDIKAVEGIGESLFQKIKEEITTG